LRGSYLTRRRQGTSTGFRKISALPKLSLWEAPREVGGQGDTKVVGAKGKLRDRTVHSAGGQVGGKNKPPSQVEKEPPAGVQVNKSRPRATTWS